LERIFFFVHHEDVVSIYPYFRQMRKLSLCVDNLWPVGSVDFLQTLIDLSTLRELAISIEFDSETERSKITHLSNLIQHTANLRSLTINSSSTSAETVCLLVPEHVRHLQVSLSDIDSIKTIIQQLNALSSLTFEAVDNFRCVSEEFSTWLMETRNTSIYRIDHNFISIWFDGTSL
jgi:hypothetical protein